MTRVSMQQASEPGAVFCTALWVQGGCSQPSVSSQVRAPPSEAGLLKEALEDVDLP